MKIWTVLGAAFIAVVASPAWADDITIKMRAVSASGVGKEIGTIRAVDTKSGLKLVPKLAGLEPGKHGFHLHQNPSCGPKGAGGKSGAGLAAGGHFDPQKTGRHEGPKGSGHLGDLPALVANDQGKATKAVVAPRLKVTDLWGHALVIHAAGDNYSDQPKALGGGGSRVACGRIVKAKSAKKGAM